MGIQELDGRTPSRPEQTGQIQALVDGGPAGPDPWAGQVQSLRRNDHSLRGLFSCGTGVRKPGLGTPPIPYVCGEGERTAFYVANEWILSELHDVLQFENELEFELQQFDRSTMDMPSLSDAVIESEEESCMNRFKRVHWNPHRSRK